MKALRPEGRALLRLIGQEIQNERTSQGLTVEQLADRAGTTPERLKAIEEGRGDPDFATLDHVVRYGLKVPMAPLVAAAERIRATGQSDGTAQADSDGSPAR